MSDNNGNIGFEDANFHSFKSKNRDLILEVDTGRILHIEPTLMNTIQSAIEVGNMQRSERMAHLVGIRPDNKQTTAPPKAVAVQSFSLAIAQKCNLGCTYCYAEQGTFGGRPDNMSIDVAKSSVDRLLKDTPPGERATLAFMGGEPLFNRKVLFATTAYAVEQATRSGHNLAFTLTTNATLIRSEDVEFFNKNRFTVTVSIDGLGKVNDTLRPYISGKGSFEQVREKLNILFAVPNRNFKVLARVTVTPKNLDLPEVFKGLLDMGFDSVQFSPMLKSPSGKEEMAAEDLDVMLEQLVACGELFRKGFLKQKILPLQNVLSTLNRIYDYQREMYPCGAGGGYMGVSVEGELYACHRFINDDDGHLGNLETGVNPKKQATWLKDRHLNAQGACNTCWARYMCSGSCHHEVIKRGRPACDYIRGWLNYCLGLFADLLDADQKALRLLLENNYGVAKIFEDEDGTGLQY